jgi:hypothetical protein
MNRGDIGQGWLALTSQRLGVRRRLRRWLGLGMLGIAALCQATGMTAQPGASPRLGPPDNWFGASVTTPAEPAVANRTTAVFFALDAVREIPGPLRNDN